MLLCWWHPTRQSEPPPAGQIVTFGAVGVPGAPHRLWFVSGLVKVIETPKNSFWKPNSWQASAGGHTVAVPAQTMPSQAASVVHASAAQGMPWWMGVTTWVRRFFAGE